MARSNRILAVDIGAGSIKIAEFEYPAGGGIVLAGFDYREYDQEVTDENRNWVVTSVLSDMLQSNKFTAGKALISISGQFALTRFVKLPPVAEEESRVRQIVEFEARQNVPFPMEEVIWDYQLIANPEAEELEVMFVVIKNEIVEQITNAVQNAGLTTLLVDVAPCACYNAARANNVGDQECEMVLNIGDRSTNLLFADRQQFFARTIPIAGHTITQQIAKEFGIDMKEAEEMKRRHGFVALGGAYEEPESEVASAVSKIVRNVMTRLHGEINRSIGVYRAQQKGNTPSRLFLTGGSSTMNYTDVFFNEKLDIDVDYLNPFKVVQLGPAVEADRLQDVAHMFSEVIGLGIRYCRQLPVEVSLIPETVRRQMNVRQKKPYLVACVACFLLILLLALLGAMQNSKLYREIYNNWRDDRARLERLGSNLKQQNASLESIREDYGYIENTLQRREQWPAILNEIGRLKPPHLWVYTLEPVLRENDQDGREADEEREEGPPGRPGGELFPMGGAMPAPRPGPRTAETGEMVDRLRPQVITEIILKGHSLTVHGIAENNEADEETAGESAANEEGQSQLGDTPEQIFEKRLKQSEMFNAADTGISNYTLSQSVDNLKTFTMRVKLQQPLPVNYPEENVSGEDE